MWGETMWTILVWLQRAARANTIMNIRIPWKVASLTRWWIISISKRSAPWGIKMCHFRSLRGQYSLTMRLCFRHPGDNPFYSNIDSMPDIRPRRKSIPLVSELVSNSSVMKHATLLQSFTRTYAPCPPRLTLTSTDDRYSSVSLDLFLQFAVNL